MWKLLLDFIDLLYITSLMGMALYGLNNMVSIVLYLRRKNLPNQHQNVESSGSEWPRVTVQLPSFNERYTIERLINAVAKFDYPRDRLQVQVLDDSTDDTSELVRRLVNKSSAAGLDIVLINRVDRSGFKAGALAEGLKSASGDLIAIFDADFIPSPDWLKKTVPQFNDPRLGCLQTRWGHLNDKFNSFTLAQSLGIDGHFVVEQTARSRNGLFMSFNGTAGIWRKTCIADAGGWQSDTLTEDLDLSYRAQLRGWQIDYLPDIVVPGELPVQVEAFKRQQFRWAKGSFQTLKKIVPALLKSDFPWYKKILGILHMSGYFVHPLMLMVVLLMLPVGIFSPQVFKWMPWTMFAAFGPPLLYLTSKTEHLPRLVDRFRLLPILTLIGFGLSLNNTFAAVEGLLGKTGGSFVRTPKFNLTDKRGDWAGSLYAQSISRLVWLEWAIGLYAVLTCVVLGISLGWQSIPWIMVYTIGYFYVAGLNLVQVNQVSRLRTKLAPSAFRVTWINLIR